VRSAGSRCSCATAVWSSCSIAPATVRASRARSRCRPVVTTSIGSNREVTNDGEAAVLVPPKDPERLAAAIRSIATDEAYRQALGMKGQQVQRERYTVSRMLDAYMCEYERLLGQKHVHATPRRVQMEGT